MFTATINLTEDKLEAVFSIGNGGFSQEIFSVIDSNGNVIKSSNASEKDNDLILLLLEKNLELVETFNKDFNPEE
jgi:hypothetical protein